jgi:hypothetical protein
MTADQLINELENLGVKLEVAGDRLRFAPREAVPEGLVSEMISHKSELLSLLSANPLPEICPQCGGTVRRGEQQNCYEAECEADPLHYSEIKRKLEADRLWADIPLPNEMDDQQILFS